MRHDRLFANLVMLGWFFFAGLISVTSAQAACLMNDSERTVYVVMKSSGDRFEHNLSVGKEVCHHMSKGSDVDVSILPYGGARFGCLLELTADQSKTLIDFHTMNKCKYLSGD